MTSPTKRNVSKSLAVRRIIIVGAGGSSPTPKLQCLLSGNPCSICRDAATGPSSRNHRMNPSLLIQLAPADDAAGDPDVLHNVLIDCGKTFRESAMKVLVPLQVRVLDAVVLTHAHADAVLGLDDIREFNCGSPIPIYCDQQTEGCLQRTFDYLFPASLHATTSSSCCNGGPSPNVTVAPPKKETGPWVAAVDWRRIAVSRPDGSQIPADAALEPGDFGVTWLVLGAEQTRRFPLGTLTVLHGKSTTCNAFIVPLPTLSLSSDTTRFVVYMSDVCRVDDLILTSLRRVMEDIMTEMAQPRSSARAMTEMSISQFLKEHVAVLIMDMLMRSNCVSHFGYHEAVDAAVLIGAERTFFVGMIHDLDYESVNRNLAEDPRCCDTSNVYELGYDGCVVFGDDS